MNAATASLPPVTRSDPKRWARVHIEGDRNPAIHLPSRERRYPLAETGAVIGHG